MMRVVGALMLLIAGTIGYIFGSEIPHVGYVLLAPAALGAMAYISCLHLPLMHIASRNRHQLA